MNFDFPIEIIRTERSKSASIEIEDDTVKVTVPQNLSDLRIEELIKNRTVWIRQKLKIQTETIRPKDKEYVNGETFSYLGRNYRLKCLSGGSAGEAKLTNGYLTVWLSEGRVWGGCRGLCEAVIAAMVSSASIGKAQRKNQAIFGYSWGQPSVGGCEGI